MKRKIGRVSELDEENSTYILSAGMVTFLETEEKENLMKFYENENGFKRFDVRKAKTGPKEEHTLIQLLKVM